MATSEEIRRRVEQADTTRSARRAAAAQQVGELAQRRAVIVEQLEDVERELGDVLAQARDVIGVEELAAFTDLKAADLTGWLAGHKAVRGKRKKALSGPGTRGSAPRSPGPTPPPPEHASTPHEESTTAGTTQRSAAQAS